MMPGECLNTDLAKFPAASVRGGFRQSLPFIDYCVTLTLANGIPVKPTSKYTRRRRFWYV